MRPWWWGGEDGGFCGGVLGSWEVGRDCCFPGRDGGVGGRYPISSSISVNCCCWGREGRSYMVPRPWRLLIPQRFPNDFVLPSFVQPNLYRIWYGVIIEAERVFEVSRIVDLLAFLIVHCSIVVLKDEVQRILRLRICALLVSVTARLVDHRFLSSASSLPAKNFSLTLNFGLDNILIIILEQFCDPQLQFGRRIH